MDAKTASQLESLRNDEDEAIANHRPKIRAENADVRSSDRFHALGRRIMDGAEQRSTSIEELREYQRTVPFTPTILAHLTAIESQQKYFYLPPMKAFTLSSIKIALSRVDEPAGSNPLFEEEVGPNDLDRLFRNPDEVAAVLSSMEETLDEIEVYELSTRRYVEAPTSSAH